MSKRAGSANLVVVGRVVARQDEISFAEVIPDDPWRDWAALLLPAVALEAVIAWLDAGQPDPDQAAERVPERSKR